MVQTALYARDLPPNLWSPKLARRPTGALTDTKGTGSIRMILLSITYSFFFSSYEFGGPFGVFAIMSGFPILMYYLWICLWFYDGKLVYPTSTADIQPFLWRMWAHIATVRYQPTFMRERNTP